MLLNFLHIRLKQGYRELQALGAGRSLFLFILLGLGEIFVIGAAAQKPHFQYLTGIYALLPLLTHLKRGDKTFLKTHIPNHKMVYRVEYLLMSIPLLLPLLYFERLFSVGVYLAAILIIIQLPGLPDKTVTYNRLLRIIPDRDFEWKAGLRKTIWTIIPVWLIGMGTAWFIGAAPVALFILGLTTLSFYKQGEPLPMLLAYEKTPNQFLGYKIQRHLKLFAGLTLPLMGMFLLFHPEQWYIPVIEWLLFLNLHLYLVLVKYAFYRPNTKLTGAQAFTVIGILITIIPVFLPLVWLLAIRFYFKAREQLNFYLYDFG